MPPECLSGSRRSWALSMPQRAPKTSLPASAHFRFSRAAGRQKVYNLMRGSSMEIVGSPIFDHQFTTGHGKSTKTWRYTVLCIRFDGPCDSHVSSHKK